MKAIKAKICDNIVESIEMKENEEFLDTLDFNEFIKSKKEPRKNVPEVLELKDKIEKLGGFLDNITQLNDPNGGYHSLIYFQNGYGASVIRNKMSYGLELAVLKIIPFYGSKITYKTPVADDVVGNLNRDKLLELLKQISELKD